MGGGPSGNVILVGDVEGCVFTVLDAGTQRAKGQTHGQDMSLSSVQAEWDGVYSARRTGCEGGGSDVPASFA